MSTNPVLVLSKLGYGPGRTDALPVRVRQVLNKMSDVVMVKAVTKSFNAAQSIWKMYLPVFITDVKDSLRSCDSPKVKAKFANAQRKMLTAWLTLMTDPKHMKTEVKA